MAVAKATIEEGIWDTIRGYLNVTEITNIAKIVSAYAKSFTKNASSKDFVAIHSPEVREELLTFTKKSYPFTILIEIVTSEEEQMKILSDFIRKNLESNRDSARGSNSLFNLRITRSDVTYKLRENVRILHKLMTLEGVYRGSA